MSYDLYFLVPEGRAPLTPKEFAAYFSGRANFAAPGEYLNDLTGVHAAFQCDEEPRDPEAEEVDDGLRSAGASFNLNFFRPHPFGLELAPELASFVEHFDLQVDDPQAEGPRRGPFTIEGFLQTWNRGNRSAFRIMAAQDWKPTLMSTADVERHWRWNHGVPALQKAYGNSLFVARTLFLQGENGVETLAVWGDGIPAALPDVDWIVVPRQELAPRGFFGLGAAKEDAAMIPGRDLEKFGIRKEQPLPHRLLSVPERTRDIESFVRGLKPSTKKFQGLPFAKVLNREFLEPSP